MGGSGGGFFQQRTPEEIREALRREEEKTESQAFDAEVSEEIAKLLGDYNDRDADAVAREVERIREALEADVESGSVTPLFGGSVRKHTYVDGVSDVDCLFVLKGEGLAAMSPAEALRYFEGQLSERFPGSALKSDKMSITIERGGVAIQVLPAVKREGRVCIASASGTEWSEIHPEAFLRKLSSVNAANGKKVVPTIKIVKGINDGLPEPQRLTGYHIEALAIEAFKDYNGPQNTKAMIERFFKAASARVLTPIRDKTGQSVHVDEYAGARGSEARRLMAQNFVRIARRIRNANAQSSVDKWIQILDPGSE